MRTLSSIIAKRLEAIQNLNLSMVGKKLMEPAPEGKGWNAEQVAEADKWYRRYLSIIVKYPEHVHVPNAPIDAFWHQHILDTKAYAKDCQTVFGFFLHHYPYFGLGGDKVELNQCFKSTNELYEEMFGENCMNMPAFKIIKAKDCCSNCPCSDGERVPQPELCRATIPNNERADLMVAASCNSGGSGTGCGQGCSRGS